MRSVFDIGHSLFDIGSPSAEHNENFSESRKGRVQLEFGQFFNDLHDLNRLWTDRDHYGQTARSPTGLEIFSFGPILRLTRPDSRRQRRTSAPALPEFAHESNGADCIGGFCRVMPENSLPNLHGTEWHSRRLVLHLQSVAAPGFPPLSGSRKSAFPRLAMRQKTPLARPHRRLQI